MKKMETSKKILLISYITAIASLVWGEVGAANIFYYKKAARENVPKVLASLSEELQSQVDINQLLSN